jgi:peptidoglycan lytic transglycosylase
MQSFSGHKTQKGALWSAAFAAQTVTPRTTPVRRCLRLSQMVRRVGLLLAYLVVPLGCLSPSEASAGERKEIGLASYYSRGQRTASGEAFDKNAFTGAHRTVRFGTSVRVTVLKTGKQVIVRINDRGPFASGRVIDVSRPAAEMLGMVGAGVARVRVEIVQ